VKGLYFPIRGYGDNLEIHFLSSCTLHISHFPHGSLTILRSQCIAAKGKKLKIKKVKGSWQGGNLRGSAGHPARSCRETPNGSSSHSGTNCRPESRGWRPMMGQ
jgi:hypothetical protein